MSDRSIVKTIVHVYEDALEKLRAEAALHGLTATDAINQAIQVWVALVEAGAIGRETAAIVIKGPVRLTTVRFVLSGDSPDLVLDETIRRIHDAEQDD